MLLLRMVPFVENNYNMVELGPRGTGKSHLFQQVSPYAHLVSGGKATRCQHVRQQSNRSAWARRPVRRRLLRRGLRHRLRLQKDGVNIMKGYMESGEFSRGKESIRATGGIVMVGNFEVDVEHQLRVGHLLEPAAEGDARRHGLHGPDPRLHPWLGRSEARSNDFTEHFGLVSDFLAEAWTRLRDQTRLPAIQGRVTYGPALSGRDLGATNRTVSGLLKLLYPDPDAAIAAEDLEWAVRLALESRRRIKEQQKRIGRAEFQKTEFSYSLDGGEERTVEVPEGAPRGTGPLVHPVSPPEPEGTLTPSDLMGGSDSDEPDLLLLIAGGETDSVEFKSSLRWNVKLHEDSDWLQKEVTKSIAAFLNGQGGTLLIGVADDGTISGIADDVAVLDRTGHGGHDGFLQALANICNQHLGGGVAPLIRTRIVAVDGREVCAIRVRRSDEPVFLHDKKQDEFYVRIQTTTRALTLPETTRYVRNHWG